MFSEKPIKKDSQGRQIIKANDILEYVPEVVLPHLEASCRGYDLEWQQIIEECTLYIDERKHCSLMYQVREWVFSGKLLLTYSLLPKHGHRVSYPNKGLFLEHTLANYGHLG